jgi:N-acetylmuramoyl-L-alanine amidase
MTYVWLDWLAGALRDEGCRVSEYSGWRNRGRPSSTGSFNPYAVLWHHTATHSSMSNPAPTLQMCVNGRSDLPGPLAHVVIGYDGVCHVIAAGRANHAGECNGNGPTSPGDGNAQLVGFEIDYDGTQNMSGEQYDAAIRAAAAVVRHFKHDQSYCRGHKETSVTGKWDPGGYSMDNMRAAVRDRLAGGGGTAGGDDMPEYLSLSGPGFTLAEGGDWYAVKMHSEHADPGKVHSEDYAWMNLAGAKYTGRATINVEDAPGATLLVRWAEYVTDPNKFDSAPTPTEFPLTSGSTGVTSIDVGSCGDGHRMRLELKARGAPVKIAGAGISVLYWR